MKKFICFQVLSVLSFFTVFTATAQSYVPVWNDPRVKVKPAANLKAYAFNLADVKLLPGAFTTARDAATKYLVASKTKETINATINSLKDAIAAVDPKERCK